MGTQEILLIGLAILLLFGGKKIPELMRGLGKGMREFKDASNGVRREIEDTMSEVESTVKADPPKKKAIPAKSAAPAGTKEAAPAAASNASSNNAPGGNGSADNGAANAPADPHASGEAKKTRTQPEAN